MDLFTDRIIEIIEDHTGDKIDDSEAEDIISDLLEDPKIIKTVIRIHNYFSSVNY